MQLKGMVSCGSGVMGISVRASKRGGIAAAVVISAGSTVEAGTAECTVLHVRTRLF